MFVLNFLTSRADIIAQNIRAQVEWLREFKSKPGKINTRIKDHDTKIKIRYYRSAKNLNLLIKFMKQPMI